EEVIRRSQKMEAVGQLAGGIAHDFNNQLNVIVGYLDFLKDYLQGDHVARPWVDKALQSTERCVHLTRRLLDFARCGSEDVERVNLNTLVVGLSELIQRTLTPEIELKLQLEESLWPVQINPSMAEDALLNLVLNARDAMTAGGRLIVETSNVALGSTNADIYPQLVPGDYVVLSISDTGMGMSEEIRQQIFTPFFTTKAVGKGTGLGLAMVYSFIQQCDGDIHVYSEPGHGTTFRLYFPRMEGTGSKRSFPEGEFVPLPDGSGTILVVDDEPDLLKLAIGYLQSLGYQTLEAGNAAQALEVLRNHAEIELLFTDVVMPGGVDGYQLAQKAVAIRPDIKILLTSGHAGKVLTTDSLVQFSTKLLLKPYTKLQLAKRIAAALR
ncbi:MAG TPA: response regulator, partial [Gammaproteobacteria bacterium]|nr:response regulator [Gammaproteobacteria bacterium]